MMDMTLHLTLNCMFLLCLLGIPQSSHQALLLGKKNCPDPYITWISGYYYLLCTTSSNVKLRRKSGDLDFVTADTEELIVFEDQNFTDIWGPELHSIDGVWNIYFAAQKHGDPAYPPSHQNWVLSKSDAFLGDPWGEYTLLGRVAAAPDLSAWANSPNVLTVPAGPQQGNYFLWGGRLGGGLKGDFGRIWIAPMKSSSELGQRVMLTQPTEPWEKYGTVAADVEGPGGAVDAPASIIAPDGSIHVTYSASGCWTSNYSLGLLSLPPGENITDPTKWQKNAAPVFYSSMENDVYGPGHNSYLYDELANRYIIAYHAKNTSHSGCAEGRIARWQPFQWINSTYGFLFPDLGGPRGTTPVLLPQVIPSKGTTGATVIVG